MFIPSRIALFSLLLCLAQAAIGDIVKPALIEISVFTDGRYRVEVRASIEALLTGINARYKNTTEAPTSDEYDRLRELEGPALLEEFAAFRQHMLQAVELRFDGGLAGPRIGVVEIPVPGYTKVPRISLIVLEGEVPDDATSLTFYYPAAFGDSAVRVRQVDEANEQWHWSAWQWIREDSTSDPFSLTEVFSPPTFWGVVGEYLGLDSITSSRRAWITSFSCSGCFCSAPACGHCCGR